MADPEGPGMLPPTGDLPDELRAYLEARKSRKQAKAEQEQAAYEALRLQFPRSRIPFENAKSPDPAALTMLQQKAGNENLYRAVAVPSYWKRKTPRILHSEAYVVPRAIGHSALADARKHLYSGKAGSERHKKQRYPKLPRTCLNLQQLYDCCEGYPLRPVLDFQYDGTDRFFLKSCIRGLPGDALLEALGDGCLPSMKADALDGSVAEVAEEEPEGTEHSSEEHYRPIYIDDAVSGSINSGRIGHEPASKENVSNQEEAKVSGLIIDQTCGQEPRNKKKKLDATAKEEMESNAEAGEPRNSKSHEQIKKFKF